MLRKIEENVKIIISLTTYPKRMQTIRLVLESLLSQTYLPDKIVLWLSEEEFDKNTLQCVLPLSEEVDIEIRWCEKNLRSHKKYYYAMQEFPDDIIITVDDDVIYKDTMIENLIKGYRCYPYAVIARRAHLITKTEDGNIAPYREWYQECTRYLNEPRMDLVATGVGGFYIRRIFCRR